MIALGYNFHPVLASFPFVIITSLVIYEIIANFFKFREINNFSLFLLALFVFFLIASFISGYQGYTYANQSFIVPEDKISKHHLYGKLLLFLCVIPISLKIVIAKNKNKALACLYYSSLFLIFLFVTYTSYLGSQLVFKYGAGVQVFDASGENY